jgi:monoamine oxidase
MTRSFVGLLLVFVASLGAAPAHAAKETRVDALVVGAGMAGVSAAQALRAQQVGQVLVLEAEARVGGRVHTDRKGRERGPSWLHFGEGPPDERNPLVDVARAHGLTLIPDDRGRALVWDGKNLSSASGFEARAEAMDRVMVRAGERGLDVPGSTLIRPRTLLDRAVANWTAALNYGVSHLDEVPTRDWAVEKPEVGDYFVREGVGALVDSIAEGTRVQLNSRVTKIEWNEDGVRVHVGDQIYIAPQLVLSPPAAALGAIEFVPPLPAWKRDALSRVKMGRFTKVILGFRRDVFDELPANSRVFDISDPERPLEFVIRPAGRDEVMMMAGGEFAEALSNAGHRAATRFAARKVRQMWGAEAARQLISGIVTQHRGGAWSRVLPGDFAARAAAERSIGPIKFATEAGPGPHAGTLAGAHLSGLRAAAKVGRAMSAR